ncbi:hypothetical protein JHK87_012122 [Glycine soja]|nr:hypothetical protein JHK87_012122 [Glycine soja]
MDSFLCSSQRDRDNQDIEENLENDATNSSNESYCILGVLISRVCDQDSSFSHVIGSDDENENYIGNSNGASSLSVQNKDICAELLKKAKKLNKLKEKDLGFSKFLESYNMKIEQTEYEEIVEHSCGIDCLLVLPGKLPEIPSLHSYSLVFAEGLEISMGSSDDEKSLDWVQPADNNNACSHAGKLLTSASVDSLCKLVKEQCSVPALTCLLNAYRAACHNVSEATSVSGCVFTRGIQKNGTFCKIFMFMLHEADTTFRRLLGISSSSSRKETVLDLKNTTKWLSVRPLIKSYIRSTVFLLNQVTDSEVLAFSICRLRASIIFLFAFPSLLRNILKEVVTTICSWQYINCIDLWVTFISANIHDYDLQPLLYMIVQIINEVALLFPGPRYLPLRLRSSEALVIKSRGFQEECVSSAIELLMEHFAKWSYHISFPELATAPLIQLKKVFERTSVESFKRVIKRFIDQHNLNIATSSNSLPFPFGVGEIQVELNIGFVQKKREEVPFSPKDQQSVESFLQVTLT